MQLTQRKKHLLKDQAGRRKEGGGRGDCCRWAQKRAIKIMEARWIKRLQDSSAEGPDKSTVFLARPFHCRDGCTKTSGMKREFFSTPPTLPLHSNIVWSVWQETGWAKEAFDPKTPVSLFRDICAAVSSFQKERMRNGDRVSGCVWAREIFCLHSAW